MDSPPRRTRLETSIANCHSALDRLDTLLRRYTRNVSFSQAHLRQLGATFDAVATHIRALKHDRFTELETMLSLSDELCDRLTELADGTGHAASSRRGKDTKASAVLELDVMRDNSTYLADKAQGFLLMSRQDMVDVVNERQFGWDGHGWDFGVLAARVW